MARLLRLASTALTALLAGAPLIVPSQGAWATGGYSFSISSGHHGPGRGAAFGYGYRRSYGGGHKGGYRGGYGGGHKGGYRGGYRDGHKGGGAYQRGYKHGYKGGHKGGHPGKYYGHGRKYFGSPPRRHYWPNYRPRASFYYRGYFPAYPVYYWPGTQVVRQYQGAPSEAVSCKAVTLNGTRDGRSAVFTATRCSNGYDEYIVPGSRRFVRYG